MHHSYQSLEDAQASFEMVTQSNETEDDHHNTADDTFWEIVNTNVAKFLSKNYPNGVEPGSVDEWISDQIENLYLSFYYFKNTSNLWLWGQLVYKLFTKKSANCAMMSVLNRCLGTESEVQAFDREDLRNIRRAVDLTSSLSENPLLKKFTKLYSYLLTQGFLAKAGLTLSADDFSVLERKTYEVAFSSRKGLWLAAFDAMLFLTEKLWDFYDTKDLGVFIHSSDEYTQWTKACDKIIALEPHLGNIGAHGMSMFQFINELDAAIDQGEACVKYTTAKAQYESTYMRRRLAQLHMIKSNLISRKSAQEERKAPMGILLSGKSGVAKSAFTKLMFYYYAAIRKLPTGSEYIFHRNPMQDHWDNFDTSKWFIHLDDIASLRPDKTMGLDPSLTELLLLIGNAAFTPPQASLEDKGKTPVRAELVVATTNTEHLNASEYFMCPLAVRRRLPYIIEVAAKPEYCKPNSTFIDPAKLTQDPTRYPDYWNITLKQLHGVVAGKTEQAESLVIHEYTNILDFLEDFAQAIKEHNDHQDQAMMSDQSMASIQICDVCLKPTYACACSHVQAASMDIELSSVPWRVTNRRWYDIFVNWFCMCQSFMFHLYCSWFMYCFTMRVSIFFLRNAMRVRCMRSILYRACISVSTDFMTPRVLGTLNSISTAPAKWLQMSRATKAVILIASACAVGASAIALRKAAKKEASIEKLSSPVKSYDDRQEAVKPYATRSYGVKTHQIYEDRFFDVPKESEHVANDPLQGNYIGTTEDQLEKETKRNVWYDPKIQLTTFDMPLASQNLVGVSLDELREKFSRNLIHLKIVGENDVKRNFKSQCGIIVKCQYVLLNKHSINREFDSWTVEVISSPVGDGVNQNVKFLLRGSEVVELPNTDLAMFRLTALPPVKSLMSLWNEHDIPLTHVCEFLRDVSGQCLLRDMYPSVSGEMEIPQLQISVEVTQGNLSCETKLGDCGALGVSITPRGPVIYGMHLLGNGHRCGVMRIRASQIDRLISLLDMSVLVPFPVQGGGAPSLTSHGISRQLGGVHHRSMMRYLPVAKVNVYGTFEGFRTCPKSSVCSTPVAPEMMKHFDAPMDHGPPAMAGWEPWRQNMEKMVNPSCKIDRTELQECVTSFVEDIIAELPTGWEKELCFLSPMAAVNGLPGVKFVDGLNRATSMGFPWNTTKKTYLYSDPSEVYPDGVNFDAEFWERYEAIGAKYQNGERAYPIFSAHLKDTPTPLKKIKMQKTRVFTGGPADWSTYVRSRLLPFVRLFQKNKFVFEAGPGTVCQSQEWGEIRAWLVAFGTDRIVGGDYGSFDKKMIADMILAAFQVIAALFKQAGFSVQECTEILCIGYDTAYSWCNFNGDLVEFFGTNPSGHPLTVVINSIVNCLYMRYCYLKLSPVHEVKTFRQNVHLMTYGDDNGMGVSVRAPWFNHTAIQAVLASIDVEYTMADKTSASRPFISIDEFSFLKRTWRWDEEVGAWMCPLDEKSIYRSLITWLPSKTVDSATQLVDVIVSANNEFFFYGKEKFEKEHSFFIEVLSRQPYCCISNAARLPDWRELVERFHRASTPINESGAAPQEQDVDLAVHINV